MKVFSAFNEKGGTGKTTFNILFASWLAYSQGARVCLVDFDYPSYHASDVRAADLHLLEDPSTPLSRYLVQGGVPPYDVLRVPADTRRGVFDPVVIWNFIKDSVLAGPYDYAVYDFAGRWAEQEPVAILGANHLVSLLAVPIDTDMQSVRSGLFVADAYVRSGSSAVAFWNRVPANMGEMFRTRIDGLFTERGIPVCRTRVRSFRRAAVEGDSRFFLRSSVTFPERYVRMYCPEVIDLFEGWKALLDERQDINV